MIITIIFHQPYFSKIVWVFTYIFEELAFVNANHVKLPPRVLKLTERLTGDSSPYLSIGKIRVSKEIRIEREIMKIEIKLKME